MSRKVLGEEIGRKIAASMGPAALMLPLKSVLAIDRAGQAFDDPAAREALYDGICGNHGTIELLEMDRHINDPEFAESAAQRLIDLVQMLG